MRLFPMLSLVIVVATASTGAPPSTFERYGNVYYRLTNGATRQLTQRGNCGEPTLSPDGRTIAFIHEDSQSGEIGANGEGALTSLWMADGPSGTIRKLLAPKPSDEPKSNLASFGHPVFSLNGGYIYVEAAAWATSSAIHQVSIATGHERFVVGGSLHGVLRNGPYRGYLVVGEHRYYPPPRLGSYNADFIIRPDGAEILRVPGTEIDDGRDRLTPWLVIRGWKL